MPEENAASDTGNSGTGSAGNTGGNDGGAEFQPITSQEQLNKLIGERINSVKTKYADYGDLKAKAAKFDEAENAAKTELQKLTEDRDGHKTRADRAEAALMRIEVGTAKGLTVTQARRLVGTTREELEADADQLIADFQASAQQSRRPPDPNHLRSGSGPDGRESGKDRAAAALRQLRAG